MGAEVVCAQPNAMEDDKFEVHRYRCFRVGVRLNGTACTYLSQLLQRHSLTFPPLRVTVTQSAPPSSCLVFHTLIILSSAASLPPQVTACHRRNWPTVDVELPTVIVS
ncbi:hypothetical protein FRB94_000481 [Tulasnella sp. JGI-2019a]|nr:hypothetical protein FRB94_000481 [Tulasnella sp. JGI-2019a]